MDTGVFRGFLMGRSATTLAADGREATDDASWYVRRASELPPFDTLAGGVHALIDRLATWRAAPVEEDAWTGPVLFVDDAAVSLFDTALVPLVRGAPSVEHAERESFAFGDTEGPPAAHLGEAILPAGWSVVDDPQENPALPSAYAYDDEGVAAQRVQLVENGSVTSLLTSRSPALGVPQSNGHARILQSGPTAEPAQLTVKGPRVGTRRQLVAQALRAAKALALDHVLIVRRLVDPSTSGAGGLSFFFSLAAGRHGASAGGLHLTAPLVAARLYADGHEEPVRGLVFDAADSGILRRVTACGAEVTRTYLRTSMAASPTSGIPVTLTVPEVLVEGLRLVPDPEPAMLPSPVKSPFAG